MMRLWLGAALLLAAPAQAGDALSGGDFTVMEQGRTAFSTMAPAFPEGGIRDFAHGRTVFNRPWLAAPAQDEHFSGLGPLFNRLSCAACHPRNGGGYAPDNASEPMRTMLVRLSVAGLGPHGGPNPHPSYGDQLNEEGIPGVAGEGRAHLHWHEVRETLPGGLVVRLRRPEIRFSRLAYGPMGKDALTSARIAPPVFGLGLLAAVPEDDILAIAAQNGGRPNRVWDAGLGRTVLGRFGWKANQPSVLQQLAGAMLGDMGITSVLFPDQNCTPAQTQCRQAAQGPQPEVSASQLLALETYHLGLGVPARRGADDPTVKAGEALFAELGCAACHRPALRTGPHPSLAQLANQDIHPYTDLLLHDMGPGLADGRPDFLAGGADWRTAPLWGLGLRRVVEPRAGLLHDGRARTAIEAILWHGGEAKAAADGVRRLAPPKRDALLRFLDSL
jgi:CxxC motif-containing protein (DUF1111 family)